MRSLAPRVPECADIAHAGAFNAGGAVLERCELCVSDAPSVRVQGARVPPPAGRLAPLQRQSDRRRAGHRLLVTLRDAARDGGVLVSHGLEWSYVLVPVNTQQPAPAR